jgi:hypothetical protein
LVLIIDRMNRRAARGNPGDHENPSTHPVGVHRDVGGVGHLRTLGLGSGRSGYSNPAIPTARGKTWFPGRDAFRYFGAGLDVTF